MAKSDKRRLRGIGLSQAVYNSTVNKTIRVTVHVHNDRLYLIFLATHTKAHFKAGTNRKTANPNKSEF